MNPRSASRRLALGSAFFLLVAGLVVWLGLPIREAGPTDEPPGMTEAGQPVLEGKSAQAAFAEDDSPTVAGRPVLWTVTGPTTGVALDPTSVATKVALIQGRQLPGRSASFTVQTPGVLAGLERGSEVILPLPGGEEAVGVVNVVLVDANGTVRAGGSLQGGGSFSVAEANGQMGGRILRPQAELAYVMTAQAGGLRIEEVWLSRVLCFNMPRPPNDPQAAPLAFGPQASVPVRSSRPGATAVLFMDFDGETVTDPDWTVFNEGNPIVAAPANLSSSQIIEVWERVREDFLPFNIDVTTDVTRYNSAPVGQRMRVIITPTSEWYDSPAGGVAFLDSFARAGQLEFSSDIPSWVFNSGVANIAEAVSHELGHTFGLSHDGLVTDPEDNYYGGHGSGGTSWGPIMGASYTRTVVQWSKGEYANANNTEDDVAIIAGQVQTPLTGAYNDVGYVVDEAGDTRASAATLGMNSGAISQTGVVATAADVDYYVFSTSATQVAIIANPANISPNLDIHLQLEDVGGNVLATSSPDFTLSASITHALAAGTYYVRISGTGKGDPLGIGYSSYGSIGHYSLTGSFNTITPVITSASTSTVGVGHLFTYAITASNSPTAFGATALPSGLSIDPNTGIISGRVTATGSYEIGLTASNGADTGNGTLTLTVSDSAPAVLAQSNPRQTIAPGASTTLTLTGFSVNGAIEYQWMRDGRPVDGATSSSFPISNATVAHNGVYWAVLTNAIGSTITQPIFVRVMPEVTQVRAWGIQSTGHIQSIPADLTDAVAISARTHHGLALKRDGTLAMWGFSISEVVASGLTDVVAISTSTNGGNSMALKGDGTLVVWNNQSITPDPVPEEVREVVAIEAGSQFQLALLGNGTVQAWGGPFNFNGELNVPIGLSGVVAIAAGSNHSLALKQDGTVVAWGSNANGQTDVPAGLSGITAIAAGGSHSLALKSDGTVVAWGDSAHGAINVPVGLTNVIAISGGFAHSMALKSDGTVVGWGGTGHHNEEVIPDDLDSVLALSGGQNATFVLRDATADTVPVIITQPVSRGAAEDQSASFTVAASGAGPKSYQWRFNGVNISGATSPTLTIASVKPSDAGVYDVIVTNHIGSTPSSTATLTIAPLPQVTSLSPVRQVIGVGGNLQLSVGATGTGSLSYQWFQNGRPIPGATGNTFERTALSLNHKGWYTVKITDEVGTRISPAIFVLVAPSLTHVRVLGSAGGPISDVPAGLTDVASLAVGEEHILALKFGGEVIAWGESSFGRLSIPAGLTDAVEVAAGSNYSLALRSDGTVISWGSTSFAQRNIPAGLSGVVAISAGYRHGLALKSDGTVVAWGNNIAGEATVPTGLSDVVAISAGADFSLALKQDGTVVAWGYDFDGKATVPGGLTDVVAISAGFNHSLALKQNGSVVAWGSNTSSQSSVPFGLDGVAKVSAGRYHSVATKQDGTFVAWGANNYGESDQVPGLVNITEVIAGNSVNAVLRDASADTIPVILTHPVSLTRAERSSAEFSITVSGAEPMNYQWRHSGVAIPGSTSSTLSIAKVGLTSAGGYDVVVTNHLGSVTSSVATLVVNPIPVVTRLSSSRHVMVPGQDLTLSVSATGTGPLGYQWLHNGRQIPGAVAPDLHLEDLLIRDGGWYAVMVTDNYGASYSIPYFVSVTPLFTQIREWGGSGSLNAVVLPEGFNDAIAIDGGDTFSLALRRNGTVFLWGATSGWSISPDLSKVVAIEAGNSFATVLDSDGIVRAWGQNYDSQTSIPADLEAVVAISSGNSHTLALGVDGRVSAWGADYNGQTSVPDGLGHVAAIAAGHSHSLALRSDGTVVAWGRGSEGQTSVPAGLDDVVGIAAGGNCSFAFKSNGAVVSWGENVPVSLIDVVGVAMGLYHGLGLRENGSIFAWGENYTGQTTIPVGLNSVLAVSARHHSSLVLRDVTGESAPGIAVSPSGIEVTELQTATFGVTAAGAGTLSYQWRRNGVNISGANQALFEIAEVVPADAGSYDVVVSNHIGSTTSAAAQLTVRPLPVVTASGPVRQILHPGQNANFSVTATGTGTLRYQWVHNGRPVIGATGSMFSIVNLDYEDTGWLVLMITDDVGTRRTPPFFLRVVPAATRLMAWGSNMSGETTLPDGLINPIEVDGGTNYSIVLPASGPARVWGHHTQVLSAPADLNDVVAVAGGAYQVLALKSDGTLRGWGTDTVMPDGLRNVVAISGGGHNANLALRSDGTVVNLSSIYSPYAAPSDLSDVVAISAGWDHLLALKVNGTVVAWGGNGHGQLAVPAELTGVKAIAAGSHHSLALKNDGSVVAWGANDYGQANVPTGLSQVIGIAAGQEHNMALKSDGTVILWGRNGEGQANLPEGVANVFALGAGRDHSMALMDITSEFPPFITDHPADKDAAPGQTVEYSIGVTGAGPFIFQWQHRPNEDSAWGNLEDNEIHGGVTTSRLNVTADAGPMNGNHYRCIVTNEVGSVISNAAQLNIVLKPEITVQPLGRSIAVGDTAQFTVTVAHAASHTYQWYRNGVALANGERISGATSPLLVISSVRTADAGNYTVQISNGEGSTLSDGALLSVVPAGTRAGDLNGDGHMDILWQNRTTGQVYLWLMESGARVGGVDYGLHAPAWQVAGVGDVDGDGHTDILWQNEETGHVYLWLMEGTVRMGGRDYGFHAPEWQVAGVGDVSGDGHTDILWQNQATGHVFLWLMESGERVGGVDYGFHAPAWKVAGVGDVNGDGHTDILWQNEETGHVYLWVMNGPVRIGGLDYGFHASEWKVSGVGDVNGDGHTDILWQNHSTGQVFLWIMESGVRSSGTDYGYHHLDWRVTN